MNVPLIQSRLVLALAATAGLGLAGCGDESGPPTTPGATVPKVQGLTLKAAEGRLQARKIVWTLSEDGETFSKVAASSDGANRAKAAWRVTGIDPASGAKLVGDGSDVVLLTVRRP